MTTRRKGIPKNELKVLESVYRSTDCSNSVYDYGTIHHSQRAIAVRLVKRRLLIARGGVVSVDGDGFMVDPERCGTGYRLSNTGYAALTRNSPEAYPAEHRRFYRAPRVPKLPGGKSRRSKE